ncbi:uncharacterized protein LOC110599434 [Ictidomys tridecemlineatus]
MGGLMTFCWSPSSCPDTDKLLEQERLLCDPEAVNLRMKPQPEASRSHRGAGGRGAGGRRAVNRALRLQVQGSSGIPGCHQPRDPQRDFVTRDQEWGPQQWRPAQAQGNYPCLVTEIQRGASGERRDKVMDNGG